MKSSATQPPNSLESFAQTAEAVAATTKKLQKAKLLGDYFEQLSDEDLTRAARYFAGQQFAQSDVRTTNVGGRILGEAICLATGSLWGRPAWGTWWEWDGRMTSMLVLLFLYFGYIALAGAEGPFGPLAPAQRHAHWNLTRKRADARPPRFAASERPTFTIGTTAARPPSPGTAAGTTTRSMPERSPTSSGCRFMCSTCATRSSAR